jgi:hypothetical protein
MIMPEVPESSLAIHHSISRGRPTTQRDMMRQICRRHGDWDDDSIIREYADAERRGDVQRIGNVYNLSPEDYARRLLADGSQRGWL